jgi:hypothetical protein
MHGVGTDTQPPRRTASALRDYELISWPTPGGPLTPQPANANG